MQAEHDNMAALLAAQAELCGNEGVRIIEQKLSEESRSHAGRDRSKRLPRCACLVKRTARFRANGS